MSTFTFKLKSKSGQIVVKELNLQDNILKLKVKLCALTNIKENAIHVLFGFPPKPLDLSNDDATISSCGLQSGDTLIVEELKTTIATASQDNSSAATSDGKSRRHVSEESPYSVSPGILLKNVVPADNSCLFTSIGFVLGGKVDLSSGTFMRQIIAQAVSNDGENYSEAILGRPNPEYCEWILKPDSWGGAIELAVMSHHYGLEIAVVDTLNAIINRFGEDQHYAQRVFLLFDGIHYDPLYLEPFEGGSVQTIFPTSDERILHVAEELALEAKASRQYTDVNHFTLRCMVCDTKLTGQVAAQGHAKETGHMSFGEIPK